jgi:hypothetical protein
LATAGGGYDQWSGQNADWADYDEGSHKNQNDANAKSSVDKDLYLKKNNANAKKYNNNAAADFNEKVRNNNYKNAALYKKNKNMIDDEDLANKKDRQSFAKDNKANANRYKKAAFQNFNDNSKNAVNDVLQKAHHKNAKNNKLRKNSKASHDTYIDEQDLDGAKGYGKKGYGGGGYGNSYKKLHKQKHNFVNNLDSANNHFNEADKYNARKKRLNQRRKNGKKWASEAKANNSKQNHQKFDKYHQSNHKKKKKRYNENEFKKNLIAKHEKDLQKHNMKKRMINLMQQYKNLLDKKNRYRANKFRNANNMNRNSNLKKDIGRKSW